MAEIRVIRARAAASVSPALFGGNMEVTRRTFWRGLSAELLADRKFFSGTGDLPLGWQTAGAVSRKTDGVRAAMVFSGRGTLRQTCRQARLSAEKGYLFRALITADAGFSLTLCMDGAPLARLDGQPCRMAQHTLSVHLPAAMTEPQIEISVDTAGTVRLHAVSLLPADHTDGLRPDAVAALRSLSLSALRFPGGCYAEVYPWKDGLLPPDLRPPIRTDLYDGDFLLRDTYGYDPFDTDIDAFMRLCAAVGAQPELTLPLIRLPLDDAADLVEYCRGGTDTPFGALRAERGHPAPYPVHEWYIGNEVYYFGGKMAQDGALAAEKTAALIRRVRAVDPDARLVLGFCAHRPEWTRAYLQRVGHLADRLSLHFYQTNEVDKNFGRVTDAERAAVLADAFLPELARAEALVRELGLTDVPFSLDEWAYSWGEPGSPQSMITDTQLLLWLMQNADAHHIAKALYFHPVNEGLIRVGPQTTVPDLTGEVFCMASALRGRPRLSCSADGLPAAAAVQGEDGAVLVMTASVDRTADTPVRFSSPLFGGGARVTLRQLIARADGTCEERVTTGTANEGFYLYPGAAALAVIRPED